MKIYMFLDIYSKSSGHLRLHVTYVLFFICMHHNVFYLHAEYTEGISNYRLLLNMIDFILHA